MKEQVRLLEFTKGGLRLGVVYESRLVWVDLTIPDGSAAETTQAVADAISRQALEPGPVVVLLPSVDCLSASIATDGLKRRDPESWKYRIEGQLPIDSEAFHAAFMTRNGSALGVVVEREAVQQKCRAIVEGGLEIAAVCPAAMFRAQALNMTPGRQTLKQDVCALSLTHPDGLDLIRIHEATPTAWSHYTDEREQRQRDLWSGTQDAEEVQTIDVQAESHEKDWIELSERLVRGGSKGWFDLSEGVVPNHFKGMQQRSRLRRFSAAYAACCLAWILFFALVAHNAKTQTNHAQHAIAQAYGSAFPGQDVPAAPLGRLRSESRRLDALTIQSGQDNASPPIRSAVPLLNDVLSAFPEERRIRATEVRITDDRLYLTGQARTHSSAEALASAIADQTGLHVMPPKSFALPNRGVAFSLSGTEVKP